MAGRTASLLQGFITRYVIALAIVGTLSMAGIAVANRSINQRVANIKRVHLQIADEPPEGANYLIIGSDTRDGDDYSPEDKLAFCDPVIGCDGSRRSDTLMVAHVEPGSRRTLIVSFPRDLLVRIPNHGTGLQKINAAYSYDGPQTVIDTLRENFGIPIHHYLEVGFKTFRDIVDAIGTVRVGFNYPTQDEYTGLSVAAGCVALDKDNALAYVRARSLLELHNNRWEPAGRDAPDIHRIERQQAFIRKLAGLAIQKSLDNPRLAITITDRVLARLTADQALDRGNVNALIRAFRTIDANDTRALEFQTLPWKPQGAADLVPGPGYENVVARLTTFGSDDRQPTTSVVPANVRVAVLDGTGGASDAGDAARVLGAQGFVASSRGTTKRAEISEIRYRPDQISAARLLAEFVEDARLVADDTITNGKITLVLGQSFNAITVTTTTTRAPGATAAATAPASATTAARPATTTTLPDPCR